MRLPGWLLAAGLMALPGAALAAPPTPMMLAQACAGCHGTRGVSIGPSMPNLAGQSQQHLAESMQGFKSDARPATVMGRLARAYTDAEILALAGYFSRQTVPVQ